MTPDEIIYAMALTRVHGLSLMNAHLLYEKAGGAQEVWDHRKDLRAIVPDAGDKLVALFQNEQVMREALARAQTEWDFVQAKHIRCIPMGDPDYPTLLLECPDAPLVLYWLGRGSLNRPHMVSMVGTRKITQYGKDLCASFVRDLAIACPDTLVVSGLAYGVDIHCHKAALDNGLDTLAVLAHGLDTIYPALHRPTAIKMIRQGGLLTEYMSDTNADKGNFVRRNRIVAGMSQNIIVVESGSKGGALITAELAGEYAHEVYAFPGRVNDEYSQGCNNLIAKEKAHLIGGIEDFLRITGWASVEEKPKNQQKDLFLDLPEDEMAVYNALKGVDEKEINRIVIDTAIPYPRVMAAITELELKGLAEMLGGARYRLRKF